MIGEKVLNYNLTMAYHYINVTNVHITDFGFWLKFENQHTYTLVEYLCAYKNA